MTRPGPANGRRPRVGLAASDQIRRSYLDSGDLQRLERFADFDFQAFTLPGGLSPVPRDSAREADLATFAAGLDALLVAPGSPFVSAAVMDAAPHLSLIGELEGDRFSHHIDLPAAENRGLRVVDTTHGSSWPTAEWALALALIGLRNAGASFRRMIDHKPGFPGGHRPLEGAGFDGAELSGKRIGMIGFGHLARRLTELLGPFHTDIVVFDPYVPRDLAEAYDIAFAPLDKVMDADAVFVLIPLTPGTAKLIGAAELQRLRAGAVFVNVSRGAVVDTAALIDRLRLGDVSAGLDVSDPEPMPTDSPLLDLPNVFVSPHIGGVTGESRCRFFALMVDELERHFGGVEPRALLTPTVASLRVLGRLEESGVERRTELGEGRRCVR